MRARLDGGSLRSVRLFLAHGKTGIILLTDAVYTFTLILESVCILPQLLLLRQTTVPTVIDSFYLVTLGSYRFFYILNWILRAVKEKGHLEPIFPISFTFGVVQTALYFDFAWVYWTRQRVKLRGGGVVDGEDISRGWLVSKILGSKNLDEGDVDAEEREGLARQEEGGATLPTPKHAKGWGPRGISVSADEGVHENGHAARGDMTDPAAFEDDLDDDAEEHAIKPAAAGISGGEEWRDDERR